MVKIPGLDDLKKMGSDLIDSAKTVNLSGVVDKLKTGVESAVRKSSSEPLSGDNPLAQVLQEMNVALIELATTNAAQANLIRKLQNQVADLTRAAVVDPKPVSSQEENPK